jgi:hypothetical protein
MLRWFVRKKPNQKNVRSTLRCAVVLPTNTNHGTNANSNQPSNNPVSDLLLISYTKSVATAIERAVQLQTFFPDIENVYNQVEEFVITLNDLAGEKPQTMAALKISRGVLKDINSQLQDWNKYAATTSTRYK